MAQDTIDLVVGCHDRESTRLHGSPRGREMDLAKFPRSNGYGGRVSATLAASLTREVLDDCDHPMIDEVRSVRSLQANDRRVGELRREERVFAIALFGTAPSRVPCRVQRRNQCQVCSSGSCLSCYEARRVLVERWVPSRTHPDVRW